MPTTHGKVTTAREATIRDLHSLLTEREMLDINEIEPRGGKAAVVKSLTRELLKAQNELDAAPDDKPKIEKASPGGEKK